MKNQVKKYVIENKQIRIYLLKGTQIYTKVNELNLDNFSKEYFTDALNITALLNALDTSNQRTSFTFLSSQGMNKLSTESFSNHNITGTAEILDNNDTLKGGTLQSVTSSDEQLGTSHTSHSLLYFDDLFQNIEDYYTQSEQLPTYVFPLSSRKNPENIVLLIQPLPFANQKVITNVLDTTSSIKSAMAHDTFENVIDQLSSLFSNWTFLESVDIDYSCSCSKDMFLGLIFSLSREELDEIFSNNEVLEAHCPLCGKKYTFTSEEIAKYLQ
ncbi:putative uncharacterized protein [Tetragenococcus halophilus subsp. halophilus]|uniref:Hsp33 family molecular chaperone HslO n=1 Tax=Tetragenococcus halophilus TaxID=51669 RepID=UPI000CA9DA2F|nr:Hsp33 family molecular chaperone HslO [Tetragenococcus halophilus]NRR75040.1 Hsp33 family molecular chaperone HslO [Tetragenococcus halophilus]WJS81338.1 Hsp33 family molecular chaperone HslO [Tetragenococcus halophilus]GBD79584.1 hypothetical protein TEHD10_0647 [Tetragenococcus halophilus subsp. halophilus]GBD82222.1 putative uncharacterized protein [Tetragenococcus halophilus subsp. halophilus]